MWQRSDEGTATSLPSEPLTLIQEPFLELVVSAACCVKHVCQTILSTTFRFDTCLENIFAFLKTLLFVVDVSLNALVFFFFRSYPCKLLLGGRGKPGAAQRTAAVTGFTAGGSAAEFRDEVGARGGATEPWRYIKNSDLIYFHIYF